jgi:hypothetical protein
MCSPIRFSKLSGMPRQFATTTRGTWSCVCAPGRHSRAGWCDCCVMVGVGCSGCPRQTCTDLAVVWAPVGSASLWRSSSIGAVEYPAPPCARTCWRDLGWCKSQILKGITTAFTSCVRHQRYKSCPHEDVGHPVRCDMCSGSSRSMWLSSREQGGE